MQILFAYAALSLAAPQGAPLEPSLPTLSWSDFDGDGLGDALAVHAGTLALYRDAAGRNPEDCAAEVGLFPLPPLSAAGWIDYDQDGAPDLFALTAAGDPLLLRNEAGAAFIDLTLALGITADEPILRAEWTDVDADGESDLLAWTAGAVRLYRRAGAAFEESRLELPAAAPIGSAVAGEGIAGEGIAGEASAAPAGGVEARPHPADGPGRALPEGRRAAPPGHAAAGAGPVATKVGGPPPRSLGVTIPQNCSKFVYDQASQECVVTSSVPALGQLYPLSGDFNVTPSGLVGMGTTSPTAKLHVFGGSDEGLKVAGDDRAAELQSSDPNVATLRVEGNGYAGFFDGRLEVGYGTSMPPFLDLPRLRMSVDAFNQAGLLDMYNGSGTRTMRVQAEEGIDNGAQLDLATDSGTNTITLDAHNGSLGGLLSMRMANGTETVALLAEEVAGNGAQLALRNAAADTTVYMDSNTSTGGGELAMYMADGVKSIQMLSEESADNGAFIRLRNGNGTATVVLDANTAATGGSVLDMYALNGQKTVEISTDETLGTGSRIVLRKYDGTPTITLDADYQGDGRVVTQELQITGGADLVESFDTGDAPCEPGTVVVIDPDRPGELRPSQRAYDRRVAGIVSGAGGVKPGIHMGLEGVVGGSTPVALTGRVYVRCTDEGGAIRPGDLLTSSSTAGCAMRAGDVERSFGAVIGKAMTALDGATGLVLVLVNLQ
jgi:hypothetical protein